MSNPGLRIEGLVESLGKAEKLIRSMIKRDFNEAAGGHVLVLEGTRFRRISRSGKKIIILGKRRFFGKEFFQSLLFHRSLRYVGRKIGCFRVVDPYGTDSYRQSRKKETCQDQNQENDFLQDRVVMEKGFHGGSPSSGGQVLD